MDKLNLLNLGALGVNVVKNPLEHDERELLSCQNVDYVVHDNEGALVQRVGTSRINSSAVSTPAVAAYDTPITVDSELTTYLYAGMASSATANWRRSSNGSSWSDDNTPAKPTSTYTGVGYFKDWPKAVTFKNKLYYPDASSPINIIEYNGTSTRTVVTIPINALSATHAVGVTDMLTWGDYIYFSTIDRVTTEPNLPGRVFRLNPNTNDLQQIGPIQLGAGGGAFATPGAFGLWQGALVIGEYTGTTAASTPRITFLDYLHTLSASYTEALANGGTLPASVGSVTSVLEYEGDLFVATSTQVAGTAAAIYRWTASTCQRTTSRTGPATTAQSAYTILWTYGGDLYAGWTDPGTTAARIEKFDGSSWTLDTTLNNTEVVCQPVILGADLYVVLGKTSNASNTASRIIKKSGGVWSEANDPSEQLRGPLALLRV